ncbi:LCP family protein [Nocardiopsis sp. LOL_012]|uniref:LCP family protein n=1 Tax=Nocardiopsis sp. LOL_012 TaxID=3345409 RepID=UPI003A894391
MAGGEERQEKGPGVRRGTRLALLWTAVSVPLPGAAHLRMGRRRSGALILGVYLLIVAALAAAAVWIASDASGATTRLAGIAVQSRWLLAAMAGVFAAAVLWMAVIVHSWTITRPPGAAIGRQVLGAATVLLLCLAVAVPSGMVLHAGYTAHQTLASLFGSPESDGEPPHDDADPWNGADRVNVLLLGSDSAENRYGTRTDSMMVASIDTETGDTVLIGLPRNLEDAQFPTGTALAERYPPPWGFDDLLNEVYQTVAEDPGALAINPTAVDPAADTLKAVIGYNIGLDVKYYAMVDMLGFRDLIDAVGGIQVLIEEPIPYGVHGGVLEPGLRRLDGYEALWYGRSRVNSDDYGRMGRQGCLIKYVADQIDPATVLTGYRELAGATQRTLTTDIPQTKVPAFIELADLVGGSGSMSTLQLSPPQVYTGNPDWEMVKALVAEALGTGGDALPAGPSASPSASPGDGVQESPGDGTGPSPEDGLTEWQEYTGLEEPAPADPGRQVGEDAIDLNTLCP